MVEFNGAQDKVAYSHGSIVNIYIVYELIPFITSTKNATLETVYLVRLVLKKY